MEIIITPIHIGLSLGMLAVFVAIFLRRAREGRAMAQHLVQNQNRRASDSDLDAYLKLAQGEGKRDSFLRELTEIRCVYGHAGVKLGHLAWIDQKLAGRLPQDAVPPAFL